MPQSDQANPDPAQKAWQAQASDHAWLKQRSEYYSNQITFFHDNSIKAKLHTPTQKEMQRRPPVVTQWRLTFLALGAELLMQMKTLVKHRPVMIALYT